MENNVSMNIASGDQDMDSASESIPVEAILYSYYVKYDKLQELTNQAFAGSDSDNLNVYIDFYQMIKSFYNRPLTGKENFYTSAVLNLAAHIRHFYSSRYKVKTKIFIIFTTDSTNIIEPIVPEWDSREKVIFNPQRDKVIGWNIKMLRMLCPYFPDLYFVEGTVESSLMIYNRIMKEKAAGNYYPSIIITKDVNALQIPMIIPNAVVIRPRKTKDGDTSFYVDQRNLLKQYREQIKSIKLALEEFIPNSMFSLFLALTSYKEKCLTAYYTPQRAITILKNMIEHRQIKNGYNFPLSIAQILTQISKPVNTTVGAFPGKNELFKNNLYSRYSNIDLPFAYNAYFNKPEANRPLNTAQKYDTRGVEEINNEYFTDNPIDFIHLY